MVLVVFTVDSVYQYKVNIPFVQYFDWFIQPTKEYIIYSVLTYNRFNH